MKNLKMKIILSISALALGVGFNHFPVIAVAEEPPETLTTIEETSVSEEVIEEQEIVENTANNEATSEPTNEEETPEEELSHTFEDFLAWVEKEAPIYGYGDEVSKAIETIKTAASEKQVTLSTLASVGFMIAVLASTIYKKVTDGKFKKEVNDLSACAGAMLAKMEELVKGTNNNTETEEAIKEEEEALRNEMVKIKNGLEHLTNGFMHFSSHVGMSNTHKAEVQRDCVKALQCIDGEVTANDINEK